MARRKPSYRPPKEVNTVQWSATALTGGVDAAQDLAISAVASSLATSVDVPAKVKAIYLEFSVYQDANAALPRFTWALVKNPGGIYTTAQYNVVAQETGQLMAFIIRTGQMGVQIGNQYTFAGWVMIPRRHQMFREADRLTLIVNASASALFCGLCKYKWET